MDGDKPTSNPYISLADMSLFTVVFGDNVPKEYGSYVVDFRKTSDCVYMTLAETNKHKTIDFFETLVHSNVSFTLVLFDDNKNHVASRQFNGTLLDVSYKFSSVSKETALLFELRFSI